MIENYRLGLSRDTDAKRLAASDNCWYLMARTWQQLSAMISSYRRT